MRNPETIAENVRLTMGMSGNVPSPCISVCRVDASAGLCGGCLRTLDEIACWSQLDDAGKRAVWARIGARAAEQMALRS
ncbi:MAG: DUF1289 domain-containing protein [Burkholderiaceae bacterium]|nr:DUF1289 domain-containing protein [Burkholderiaceae bacterium]